MVSKDDINNFLRKLKRIASKRGIPLIPREKNELGRRGLTMLDFHQAILSLTYKNYYKGPEPSKGIPLNIWIFGKIIDYDEYYIKLEITHNETRAVCISFHPSELPIRYPLK